MWLIVGLGNPGAEYAATRHNIGFMAADRVVASSQLRSVRQQAASLLRQIEIQHCPALVIQPHTFMNRSGLAVHELLAEYGEPPEHLIVMYDDLDLALGRLRIRPRGGHGGQKGMQSLIQQIGTQAFPRIRIGIGRPDTQSTSLSDSVREHVIDYVLQPFQHAEQAILQTVLDRAVKAVELIVTDQIEIAMNLYNRSAPQNSEVLTPASLFTASLS